MRIHPVTLAVFLATATLASPPAAGLMEGTPEAWSTLLDLEVIGVVLFHADEREMKFGCPPGDWRPLDECTRDLPEALARRLPRRDAWGRKLLISTLEGHARVLSSGENGRVDTVVSVAADLRPVPRNAAELQSVYGDDLVVAVGYGVLHGPATTAQRQRLTMTDLRAIATSVESFAVDNDRYPLQDAGMQTVGVIRDALEPIYIRELPIGDGWGNPYLYWSDGLQYVITSAGSDGVFERRYDLLPLDGAVWGGGTSDSAKDIVFVDGQFVQWVESTEP